MKQNEKNKHEIDYYDYRITGHNSGSWNYSQCNGQWSPAASATLDAVNGDRETETVTRQLVEGALKWR